MKNRDLYRFDLDKDKLLNQGVAGMSDAITLEERRVLRFEIENFVCEGEYRRGLVRILQSYLDCYGDPTQPAAWISGFFGSGKSHLAKMLRFLWMDYKFPEDEGGGSARGLARLPEDLQDQLKQLSTQGRRAGGLHAAAGLLGSGSGGDVQSALLGIVFKSVGLSSSFPQAKFCLWLKREGLYQEVRNRVEQEKRDFQVELQHLYVSPTLTKVLLEVQPGFAPSQQEVKKILRTQFSAPKAITMDTLVDTLWETLAPDGRMPCTAIILDEVQQYIGEDQHRSYAVQEVVEACGDRFEGRLLLLGTGQSALTGTPALQRLQGRFPVHVELSDRDVEEVTRQVVLEKRLDCVPELRAVWETNAGELKRHLAGTRIGHRVEDKKNFVRDYPLLPVRRRFWEHALRAADIAGTSAQLRNQLTIIYEALRETADDPLGTVVPADFLFDQLSSSLMQSGVLLKEINEKILAEKDKESGEGLRSRICALVFLIRKLPREQGVDIGVRATAETLADLLVRDLAEDGLRLRVKMPNLLNGLVEDSVLVKLEQEEYALQTREGSEWESEFKNFVHQLREDLPRLHESRTQLLREEAGKLLAVCKITQGNSKEPRKINVCFGAELPPEGGREIAVWVRDGWEDTDSSSMRGAARAAGSDSPVIHVFVPALQAEDLKHILCVEQAARDTLNRRGEPATAEGREARQGMQTRRGDAERGRKSLISHLVEKAQIFQGGGEERRERKFSEKILKAAEASQERLFPNFREADSGDWSKVLERARKGADRPLEGILGHEGDTHLHPVCVAILECMGSGKKGKEIREYFSGPPYGWPRDAVDAALISLLGSGHLRATINQRLLKEPAQLDQRKIPVAHFRVEGAALDAYGKLELRKLFQRVKASFKPGKEEEAAKHFLSHLVNIAEQVGGEVPLPVLPDLRHLQDLQALTGSEQLRAILEQREQLWEQHETWSRAAALVKQRFPVYQQLCGLRKHAEDLEAADQVDPALEAMQKNRTLLESPDLLPGLKQILTSALRGALTEAEQHASTIYDREQQHLAQSTAWGSLSEEQRQDIFHDLHLTVLSKGDIDTPGQLFDSLERSSLNDWWTHAAALPELFRQAHMRVEQLLEPTVRHLKLPPVTLRSSGEVEAWIKDTKRTLLQQVRQGPVVLS